MLALQIMTGHNKLKILVYANLGYGGHLEN